MCKIYDWSFMIELITCTCIWLYEEVADVIYWIT